MIRIRRSLDTWSRSSFKMAVILVREVPARLATSAWVTPCLRTIALSRLSKVQCTSHSFASVTESPSAAAKSSGVLAIIGFSLGIEKLLQPSSAERYVSGSCLLGLLRKSVKDQNTPRRRGEIEHRYAPSSPLTRSSETPGATAGIGLAFGIPSCSPICSRKRPLPKRVRTSLGKPRIASRAPGERRSDAHRPVYQIWDLHEYAANAGSKKLK